MNLLSSLLKAIALWGSVWTFVLLAAVVMWAKLAHELTWREAVKALWWGIPIRRAKVITLGNRQRAKTTTTAPAKPMRLTWLTPVAAATMTLLVATDRVKTAAASQLIPFPSPALHAIP